MNWSAWRLKFDILSPIHIGFHKVANLQRTRYYVPGRVLWGAVVSRLAIALGIDYEVVGNLVRTHLPFGYLFPMTESGEILYPNYSDGELKYGSWEKVRFESLCLSSYAATAIEVFSSAAEDGSLHEIELLLPRTKEKENLQALHLVGILFAKPGVYKEGDVQLEVNISGQGVSIKAYSKETNLFDLLKRGIRVGGERRYGFGYIRLRDNLIEVKNGEPFLPSSNVTINLSSDPPQVRLTDDSPLLAHASFNSQVLGGEVEAFVGRDWEPTKGSGRKLTPGGLYWVPGSISKKGSSYVVKNYGRWE